MKEQEQCEMLESLLNRADRDFTDADLDRIGETFAALMSQIFG